MANVAATLRRIRRARQREAPPTTRHFESYRSEYESILQVLDDLAGDPAVEELTIWVVDRTRSTGALPEPDVVRERALKCCTARGIDVPAESPLRSE